LAIVVYFILLQRGMQSLRVKSCQEIGSDRQMSCSFCINGELVLQLQIGACQNMTLSWQGVVDVAV
jgi:hypothetical protein